MWRSRAAGVSRAVGRSWLAGGSPAVCRSRAAGVSRAVGRSWLAGGSPAVCRSRAAGVSRVVGRFWVARGYLVVDRSRAAGVFLAVGRPWVAGGYLAVDRFLVVCKYHRIIMTPNRQCMTVYVLRNVTNVSINNIYVTVNTRENAVKVLRGLLFATTTMYLHSGQSTLGANT